MTIFKGVIGVIKLKAIPWNWIVIAITVVAVFVSKIFLHLSWIAIGVLVSLIGILISLFFNCLNLKKLNESKKEERSQFLLQEIKQGFSEIIRELENAGNNHFVWHKVVKKLQTFCGLSGKLMKVHRLLYDVYFEQLRFDLNSIIVRPNKLTFFYGIPNWENTRPEEAYNHSYSIRATGYSLNKGFAEAPSVEKARYFRISPRYLRYLIRCANLSCHDITEDEFTSDEQMGYVGQFPAAVKYLDDLDRRSGLFDLKQKTKTT